MFNIDKYIVQNSSLCRSLTFVSIIACIAGAPHIAHATVLEETDAGLVLPMENGIPERPVSSPAQSEVDHVHSASPTQAPLKEEARKEGATAVIFDAAREQILPVRLLPVQLGKTSALPRPRAFTSSLSPQQKQMRNLTVAVAHRFARSRGVVRANLDRKSFVALFTTMIHRESNFRVKAVSPVGAKGLGQLMPGTAKDLGVCDVFSPQDNLNGAATYLTMMLEQFGTPSAALAAYNAGPGAVARYKGIPPYKETRQYVADIMSAAQNLKADMHSQVGAALAYQDDDGANVRASPFDAVLTSTRNSSRCYRKTGGSTLVGG